jgi:hypothetical protein
MMRKKLYLPFLAAALCAGSATQAQLFIDNAQFFIQSGATVTVQGDVTSNTDILGTGRLILKGSANQNVSMAGSNIPNLEVDNASNATLTTAARVSGDLLFTNGDLLLGANNLTLGSSATVTNANDTRYVVTNGTGRLVKAALGTTPFVYPVGNSVTSYNPVTISNAGTADDIGVRVLANALTTGTTGSPITREAVDATWDVTEAVAGGSNLSLTATWAAADELPGLNRAARPLGVSNYITSPAQNVGWDLLLSQAATASGAGPYSVTRTGISNVGAFTVGHRPVMSPLLVGPKVFLQGAYNTTTGLMTDNLRINNLIPTTEPYTGLTGFTHSGSGGGEASVATVVGSAAAAGNDAVTDWVFAQLHRASDSVVISTRAVLVQRDGDIVDTDGVSPVNFAGNAAGNYYVSFRHRNHLGVRSAATLSLAKTTATAFNFTTGLGQAYTKNITNNAMATMGTVFGMWAGNVNDDITVRMTGINGNSNDYLRLLNTLGSSITTLPSVYNKADLNLDGTVRMTGINAASNDYLRLLNTLGTSTSVVAQPAF